MTEGKRNTIHQLLEEYDIQDVLKVLLGDDIKEIREKVEEIYRRYKIIKDYLIFVMGVHEEIAE